MVQLDGGASAVLGITTAPTGLVGIRRKMVSPYGCAGGWVALSRLSGGDTSTLASILCQGEVIWRVGPSDELVPDAVLGGARNEVTHVIDLRSGAEAARASWSASARRRVGRAERAGITVRAATGAADWDAYGRIYERTLERWDAPITVYDDRLFEIIPRIAGGEALLVLAEQDGEACAGAIVFLHGRNAAYWHGASDTIRAPGSSNAVQWEVLGMLERQGIETYDLLGSGPLAGVVEFKERIGGVPHRVRTVVRSHPLVAAARTARRQVARRRGR